MLTYWVREVPAGAKIDEVDHYVLLGGEHHCNQVRFPMQFSTWDMAQAMANALMANQPTAKQRTNHMVGGKEHE